MQFASGLHGHNMSMHTHIVLSAFAEWPRLLSALLRCPHAMDSVHHIGKVSLKLRDIADGRGSWPLGRPGLLFGRHVCTTDLEPMYH